MRSAHAGPPWVALSAAAWAVAPAGGARGEHRGPGGAGPARCLGSYTSPRELLLNLTSAPEYSWLEHPGAARGTPTRVEQQIYIAKLVQLDENKQTMTISGYWRSTWLDERLAFRDERGDCFDYLDVDLKPRLDGPPGQDLIWTPSLFFDNALTESYASYSFQVMPSGQVVRSIKILHSFSCAMDFGRMPFDKQNCPVRIMSYDQPDSSVVLVPKDGAFVDGTRNDDGDGSINVCTTLWDSAGFPAAVEKEGYTVGYETEFYDVLTISFVFQRRLAYSMRRDVGYAILFVCMTYVGFFVEARQAPARAALAVIPVLTMLNHLHYVDGRLPPLSESTWLNTFLVLSLSYTGIAMFELLVVSVCLNLERVRETRMATFKTLAKRMQDVDHPLNDRERKLFETLFKLVENTLSDQDGMISASELRGGLRYFNVYYSLEQCSDVIAVVHKQHRTVSGRWRPSILEVEHADPDAPAAAEGRGEGGPGGAEATPAAGGPRRREGPAVGAPLRGGGCGEGAAAVCPGFPRSLASFGAPVPLPGCSREAALPLGPDRGRGAGPLPQKLEKPHQRQDGGPAGEAHDAQETPGHQKSCSLNSISHHEFRTLLIMLERGDVNPTPMLVTRFFDQRPSEIVDGLARYLFLTTYAFCMLITLPTVTLYPSNADQ